MGHIRLGRLPKTHDWEEVVALVDGGASAEKLASATANAAEVGFARAPNDAGMVEAFWLLTALPAAAKGDPAAEVVAEVAASPSIVDLTANAAEALERGARKFGRTSDLGEMAQLAAVEALGGVLADRTQGLFDTTPGDVRAAVRDLGKQKEFGHLARTFFARLAERYLTYYLSRELPAHVGTGGRFASLADHRSFNHALTTHCYEAAAIVEKFAGDWYAKHAWTAGGISRERAGHFAAVAFKKLRAELRKRARNAA